jgi:adenine phosphoribosyltransferase
MHFKQGNQAMNKAQDTAAIVRAYIREIPDFPQPGILFRDITPLLADAYALRTAIDAMTDPYRDQQIDKIVGIESRGFLFGIPMAYQLNIGFVPVRKKGKLPYQTVAVDYALEYGINTVEVHADAVLPGQRVVIVDDLLATGGTAAAAVQLIRHLGAQVVGLAFAIELSDLKGRSHLGNLPIHTLVTY